MSVPIIFTQLKLLSTKLAEFQPGLFVCKSGWSFWSTRNCPQSCYHQKAAVFFFDTIPFNKMVAVLVLFRGGGGSPKNFAKHKSFSSKIVFFCKVDLICDDLLPFTTQNVFPFFFHSKRRKGLWTGIGRASGQRVVKVSERSRKTGPSKAVNDLWMSQTGLNRSLMLTYYLILAIMLKPLTGCWFSIFGGFLPLMFCIGKPRWMYMHPKKSHPWRRIIDICFLLADIAFPHMIVALPFGKHGPCGLIWISVLTSASVSLYRRMCRSLTSELKSREEK